MKNHVLRPLWVAIGAVALVLIVRHLMVPADFGVHGKNFTYGFHRQGSIADWQDVGVKYKGKEICKECHEDKCTDNASAKHSRLECENCHGPAMNHPEDPAKLVIDRSRDLCLRCHASLPYPNNPRGRIPGIDPVTHNPGQECSACHNPHKPNLEAM